MTVNELLARWSQAAPDPEPGLRWEMATLTSAGLSEAEALLVALGRRGRVDAATAGFTRQHADELMELLTGATDEPETGVSVAIAAERGASATDSPDMTPDSSPPGFASAVLESRRTTARALVVALALAVAAGAAVKIGISTLGETRFALTAGSFVIPFLVAYFAWLRGLSVRTIAVLTGIGALLTVALATYPFEEAGDAAVAAVLHAPVVWWLVMGVAQVGGEWRSAARRMDFVRFTGEFVVYYALLALGGGLLIGLTVGSFAIVDIDISQFVGRWLLPGAIPGAVLVAAWLVDATNRVADNVASVLAKVFTPLTIAMLLALIVAYAVGIGRTTTSDRVLLIVMDAVLVVVLALVLYVASARNPAEPARLSDALQLALVCAALVVDLLAWIAMLGRIAEVGLSANRITAMGLNLALLVNLARSAWLCFGIVLGRRGVGELQRWQMAYLPVFAVWAAVVVVVIPPVFSFA